MNEYAAVIISLLIEIILNVQIKSSFYFLQLVVHAWDSGNPAIEVSTVVTLRMLRNEFAPTFFPNRLVESVSEHVAVGTNITRVTATDLDIEVSHCCTASKQVYTCGVTALPLPKSSFFWEWQIVFETIERDFRSLGACVKMKSFFIYSLIGDDSDPNFFVLRPNYVDREIPWAIEITCVMMTSLSVYFRVWRVQSHTAW